VTDKIKYYNHMHIKVSKH